MRPTFSLTVAGQDRSAVLRDRLVSLRTTETTDHEADEITLSFDDRAGAIVLPRHGASLDLAIGYAGAALVRIGSFVVDETTLSGPPDLISVRAKASDMRASLKAQKRRAWRATTVGAVVGKIASEHGLQAQAHPDLAGLAVAHLDQSGESDLHFLTRLGREHDATASVKGGKLVFAPKGTAVSGSGRALGPLALTRRDLTSWSMTNADRSKHGTVRARHRHLGSGTEAYEEAGSGDPVRTLRHVHRNAAHARAAAHAAHRRTKREAHPISLTLPGRPEAFAGVPIEVSGLRDGLNGRWIAHRVEHEQDYAGGGFTTRIEATVDGLSEDAGDGDSAYGGDNPDSGSGA